MHSTLAVAAADPQSNQEISRAAEASLPTHAQRVAALDAARLLAALAVVWIHVPRSDALLPTSIFGRFAVPFFTAAAIYFVVASVAKRPAQPLIEFIVGKMKRLYVPFLAWSGLYLLFKFAKYLLLPDQPNDFPGVEVIWLGASYHLWFIPFLIAASVIVFAIAKLTVSWIQSDSKIVPYGYWGAIALGIVVALIPIPWGTDSPTSSPSDSPLEYVWDAVPSVFWGFALALTAPPKRSTTEGSSRRPIAALGLMIFVLFALFLIGRNALLENYAGMLLLIAAFELRTNWIINAAAKFGPYALGIYFSHLLIFKILETAGTKLNWPTTALLDLGLFVAVSVISALVSIALAKHRATRWLVV